VRDGLTIAVLCHNYQRRFCWMLSSLAQQDGNPAICVDVAALARNGKPTTERVVAHFADAVDVRLRTYRDVDRFQFRGLVRTDQLRECETEWLLFADCDMVYHPSFFVRLLAQVAQEHADYCGILTAGRWSQPNDRIAKTDELVGRYVYPCHVPFAAFTVSDTLELVARSNVGAGFFQLINVRNCQHGGYYADGEYDHAWATGRYWKTRSDHRFRRRIGERKKLPAWFSDHQWHLNHHRDNQSRGKRHLEEQR